MVTYKLDKLELEQGTNAVTVKYGDMPIGIINGVIKEEMEFYRIYVNILKSELCVASFIKGGVQK
jgi:hypothetical protein